MCSATVTQKGQITIPLALRKKFGLKSYGRARLEPGDDFIKIYSQEDILDIAGTFIPKKKKSIIKAREVFEKNVAFFDR